MQSTAKFVLRIPGVLHSTLKDHAKKLGISLNDICIQALTQYVSATDQSLISNILAAPFHLLSVPIEGIVIFGSVAKDEAFDSSDIDLLLVLPLGTAITRSLYTEWDEKVASCVSPKIVPHFVALPNDYAISNLGSIWLEVALDGNIIFDPHSSVVNVLSQLRHRIAKGEFVRLTSHGSGYWMKPKTMEQTNNA